MADVSGYHLIHTAIRGGADRLAVAVETIDPADAGRTAALAKYWSGYTGEVLMHHTVEDEIFFPALVERFDWAKRLIARTDAEHHELDSLMSACDVAVARMANGIATESTDLADRFGALAHHMDAHLTFEDEEILPVFEQQFDEAEYQALDQKAKQQNLSIKQSLFTVPFIGHAVPEDERAQVLSDAPAALGLIWRLTNKRHARLMDVVFGHDALATPEPARVRELVAGR